MLRMMRKDPEERYANPLALAQALRPFSAGPPWGAAPAPSRDAATVSAPRNTAFRPEGPRHPSPGGNDPAAEEIPILYPVSDASHPSAEITQASSVDRVTLPPVSSDGELRPAAPRPRAGLPRSTRRASSAPPASATTSAT